MVGNFPLLSSYSTKMLGYLEIDPYHPLVDEDGKSAVATTGMSAFAAGTRQGALMQQVNPSLINSGLI